MAIFIQLVKKIYKTKKSNALNKYFLQKTYLKN